MNLSEFRLTFLMAGGSSVEYAYLGIRDRMRCGAWNFADFQRLTMVEVSIITNSFGSNFDFRGEQYKFKDYRDGAFTYASQTKSLAYGDACGYVFIVFGSVGSHYPCLSAVERGLSWIKTQFH